MSDILEQLLGVEKNASVLTSEAEAEANRRKTLARIEAQKDYSRLLAEKAKELERRVNEEREKLKVEREEKNRSFAESLRAHPLQVDGFRRLLLSLIASDRR